MSWRVIAIQSPPTALSVKHSHLEEGVHSELKNVLGNLQNVIN